jgi:hypothetical protein
MTRSERIEEKDGRGNDVSGNLHFLGVFAHRQVSKSAFVLPAADHPPRLA